MNTKTKPKKSIQIPAACPRCLSTKFKASVAGTTPLVRNVCGTIDNFAYHQVTWSKRKCECGQIITTRTYSR